MDNHDSLLNKINELYTKISRMLFKRQAKSYHPGLGDVSSTMQQLIDDLVTDVSSLSSENYRETSDILHTNATSVSASVPPTSQSKKTTASVNNNDKPEDIDKDSLATEFKSEKQRSMKTTLQQSTWDHVHSAHRYAREGNRDKALFHIKLASDALDTLRYYMAGKEYEDFVALIYDQLGMKNKHQA